MNKASSLGIALNEETITETVLYEIALAHQKQSDIKVDIATKPEEARHGGDWEWWIKKGNAAISFRVQAKRLFPDGTYRSLLKTGKDAHGNPIDPYSQLNKLVNTAQRDDHIPLYCFYNFKHTSEALSGIDEACQHQYKGPSFWGCSFAAAQDVMATGSNALSAIRPVMEPWHKLVCDKHPGLLDSTEAFAQRIRRSGVGSAPDDANVKRRSLPGYVRVLVELREPREQTRERHYVDYEYWQEATDAPEDIGGLIVFDDRRG